jgi:hypothetical protein
MPIMSFSAAYEKFMSTRSNSMHNIMLILYAICSIISICILLIDSSTSGDTSCNNPYEYCFFSLNIYLTIIITIIIEKNLTSRLQRYMHVSYKVYLLIFLESLILVSWYIALIKPFTNNNECDATYKREHKALSFYITISLAYNVLSIGFFLSVIKFVLISKGNWEQASNNQVTYISDNLENRELMNRELMNRELIEDEARHLARVMRDTRDANQLVQIILQSQTEIRQNNIREQHKKNINTKINPTLVTGPATEITCIACENKPNYVLKPCGHPHMCVTCHVKWLAITKDYTCSLCTTKVEEFIVVYL